MRKQIGILSFFVCIGMAWSGGDDPRAVVNKAIKAAGGEKNLARFNTMSVKEKGTYYGMGEGLPYTGVSTISYPDHFRMEIVDVFTLVVNAKKGWTHAKGETKEMSADQLAEHHANQRAGWITSLLPLKDKAFTLKLLAEAKIGNAPASAILVTRKDYPDVTLYFDKKSSLLVKSEHKAKAEDLGFKEVMFETTYSDYRDVDGAKHPHKWSMKREGKLFVESEITEIRAVKYDAKTFSRPE